MTDIFAVVLEKTTYHEGDQRSRDYPGHGYPAHSTTHKELVEFKSEQDFKAWIISHTDGYYSYKAYKLTPLNVVKEVSYKY